MSARTIQATAVHNEIVSAQNEDVVSVNNIRLVQVANEQSPNAEDLQAEILGIIKNIWDQITETKRKGDLPAPVILKLPSLEISPDMSADTRLLIVDQNADIYEKVTDQLTDFPGGLVNGIVQGRDEISARDNLNQPEGEGWIQEDGSWIRDYRGAFWFITRDLAILEKYPVDEFANPIAIETLLLVSRDAVQSQIKHQKSAPAYVR